MADECRAEKTSNLLLAAFNKEILSDEICRGTAWGQGVGKPF